MNITTEELPNKPGFYKIPGFSRYAINRDGDVWSIYRGAFITPQRTMRGYMLLGMVDDVGKYRGTAHHRALALTFLRTTDWTPDLEVNHINGIKDDNRLENLEWITHQANVRHAHDNGFVKGHIKVSVRDVNTGEIRKYDNIPECARVIGLTKYQIQYRVGAGECRVFPEGLQYRQGHGDDKWYIPINIAREILVNGIAKPVSCRWLLTGKEMSFITQSDLGQYLGLSSAALSIWLNKPNQPVLPGCIQLKWTNDDVEWRHVEDPYAELTSVVVQSIHESTGRVDTYETAKECADARGIGVTALNYRLQSRGRTVFKDGYRYRYYGDKS